MKLKIKIMAFLVLLVLFISTFQSTYSRYVSAATGTVSVEVAHWSLAVNNQDIVGSTNNTVSLTPTIVQNANVAEGKMAPGSQGYIDIFINPKDIEVSYDMTVSLSGGIDGNSDLSTTDLRIYKYGMQQGTSYNSANTSNEVSLTQANVININQTFLLNNHNTVTGYSPYVLRIFFQWYDGVDNITNDDVDTALGNAVTTHSEFNPQVSVSLTFTQHI